MSQKIKNHHNKPYNTLFNQLITHYLIKITLLIMIFVSFKLNNIIRTNGTKYKFALFLIYYQF